MVNGLFSVFKEEKEKFPDRNDTDISVATSALKTLFN
jgi:hypothetical protein